jgi:hypothetical protein
LTGSQFLRKIETALREGAFMILRELRAAALVALSLGIALPTGAEAGAGPSAGILTITLDGTLGPIISGNDPAGLNGQSAMVTVTASESLTPYKMTAGSASYHIPAGDITVTVNGTKYTSTSRSSMIVRLGKKADLLTLKANITVLGHKVNVTDVSALQSGSWTTGVLQHPALFSPSPQNLTEPSSTFTYTVFGETTVLGVTGTASDSD